AAMGAFPIPAYQASLAWFDQLRSSRLPAALIQAQRDYFGHHGFLRIDDEEALLRHGQWSHSEQNWRRN
ncbi:MAG: hypothetical protein PHS41_12650, partial [Victivallaceae bacterium]|nr:hypothetical protein [Victivallaceae bacterium]